MSNLHQLRYYCTPVMSNHSLCSPHQEFMGQSLYILQQYTLMSDSGDVQADLSFHWSYETPFIYLFIFLIQYCVFVASVSPSSFWGVWHCLQLLHSTNHPRASYKGSKRKFNYMGVWSVPTYFK